MSSRLASSRNRTDTLVPVVAKILLGMDTTPRSIVVHQFLADALLDAVGGGDEAGGYHNRGFTAGLVDGHDVLDEEQVDRHLVLGFFGHIGDAGEEAIGVGIAVQVVAEIGKIQLERRVRDDVVELHQFTASGFG